ncbi:hypothetical protein HYH03_000057 [Edaphochlamys debaryana]|uniref:Uncharacterized protein n=1 Tax=Edaphochlamys debaryana TaxID=47281 RepID=A0A836C655_9CHLO|nr:hypothetical protein HYH03_000057 [Edaphochlamys debaryana]|eukprot:KAG2501550.1 hypothetical protein HYH03_000057 [Edaphochlamys debaryana]
MEERGNGLPAYMATATPNQLSAHGTQSYKTALAKGTGLAGYNQKRRLHVCQCGVCQNCLTRARGAKYRAKKAAAKAVVGTLVEVVDLTED